ncbi:iron reductase [Pseudorhizobium halotolerans]|uniref:Iron reductase n=1 Tax=Pseudorhizobium halotolerans TaxID=1233081 RepID=A0ABN7K5Z2_9HYPH|nr:ferredoxin reductase family protein [Pseudorhizobium halotolerans]CAD7057249.1 iron reductase [Pseudorhizobium halotolerans]
MTDTVSPGVPSTTHSSTHGLPRLPAGILAALYIGLCATPLALSLTANVAPSDSVERLAAGLGMVALAAMAVQFVTSGRFEVASGRLGIDKIMAFHKIAAWWILLAIVFHPILYVAPTLFDDQHLGRERLTAYLTLTHYRSGVVAWVALVILVLSSALRNRLPWRYELWRGTHLVLGAIAIGGGLHHAVTTGRFAAMGPVGVYWISVAVAIVAVLLTLYGYRWLKLHRKPWRLKAVTRRADRLWELDIQPDPGTPQLAYHAGQFVWMTEGTRRFPLLDHPFSIADSPTRSGISLIIKEVGDFTSQIGSLKPGTPIGIDGPYGEFALEAHPGDAVLLVAGGVGIAPIVGILRDMVARRERRPVRVAYAVGTPANFACVDEIAAAGAVLDLKTLLISEEAPAGWDGAVGRLDNARLGELLEGLEPKGCVAMMCGPGGMVSAVSDTLLDLGLPMKNVVYERFDYSGGASSRQDRRCTLAFVGVGGLLAAAVAAFSFSG